MTSEPSKPLKRSLSLSRAASSTLRRTQSLVRGKSAAKDNRKPLGVASTINSSIDVPIVSFSSRASKPSPPTDVLASRAKPSPPNAAANLPKRSVSFESSPRRAAAAQKSRLPPPSKPPPANQPLHTFEHNCEHCDAKLRFSAKITAQARVVGATCPSCKAELRIRLGSDGKASTEYRMPSFDSGSSNRSSHYDPELAETPPKRPVAPISNKPLTPIPSTPFSPKNAVKMQGLPRGTTLKVWWDSHATSFECVVKSSRVVPHDTDKNTYKCLHRCSYDGGEVEHDLSISKHDVITMGEGGPETPAPPPHAPKDAALPPFPTLTPDAVGADADEARLQEEARRAAALLESEASPTPPLPEIRPSNLNALLDLDERKANQYPQPQPYLESAPTAAKVSARSEASAPSASSRISSRGGASCKITRGSLLHSPFIKRTKRQEGDDDEAEEVEKEEAALTALAIARTASPAETAANRSAEKRAAAEAAVASALAAKQEVAAAEIAAEIALKKVADASYVPLDAAPDAALTRRLSIEASAAVAAEEAAEESAAQAEAAAHAAIEAARQEEAALAAEEKAVLAQRAAEDARAAIEAMEMEAAARQSVEEEAKAAAAAAAAEQFAADVAAAAQAAAAAAAAQKAAEMEAEAAEAAAAAAEEEAHQIEMAMEARRAPETPGAAKALHMAKKQLDEAMPWFRPIDTLALEKAIGLARLAGLDEETVQHAEERLVKEVEKAKEEAARKIAEEEAAKVEKALEEARQHERMKEEASRKAAEQVLERALPWFWQPPEDVDQDRLIGAITAAKAAGANHHAIYRAEMILEKAREKIAEKEAEAQAEAAIRAAADAAKVAAAKAEAAAKAAAEEAKKEAQYAAVLEARMAAEAKAKAARIAAMEQEIKEVADRLLADAMAETMGEVIQEMLALAKAEEEAAAATLLQSAARAHIARALLASLKEEKIAAIMLQSVVRGNAARVKAAELVEANAVAAEVAANAVADAIAMAEARAHAAALAEVDKWVTLVVEEALVKSRKDAWAEEARAAAAVAAAPENSLPELFSLVVARFNVQCIEWHEDMAGKIQQAQHVMGCKIALAHANMGGHIAKAQAVMDRHVAPHIIKVQAEWDQHVANAQEAWNGCATLGLQWITNTFCGQQRIAYSPIK